MCCIHFTFIFFYLFSCSVCVWCVLWVLVAWNRDIHSFFHSFICSFVHSFTRSLTHSLSHSFIHSFNLSI